MTKLKLHALILGILNIIAGLFLSTFVILMQNLIGLIAGITYIIFGIAMISNKIYKLLLFYIIIPLTILFSFSIIMSGIDKDVPEYFRTPLYIGFPIIMPLWCLIFANIWISRKYDR